MRFPTARKASTPLLRPPFVAGARFIRDFAWAWEREVVCCYCGRAILPGETVAWGRAWRPDSLHHLRCRPERAGEDGA